MRESLLTLALLGLLALGACGHTDTYAVRVTNSVKSWNLIRQWCAKDDSTLCTPANMRAMANASLCPEASALYSNDQPLPDGIPCKPPGGK